MRPADAVDAIDEHPRRQAMTDESDFVRRNLDLQARARNYRMFDVPGYREWSQRKLSEGESEAFIAHLDAGAMWMLPEELSTVTEDVFEDMLDDLKSVIARNEQD
jgi:hypothetical protein